MRLSAAARNYTAGMFRPPTSEQPLKLNFNENNQGISPLAHEALLSALAEVHRYPDRPHAELTVALAEHHGVGPQQVTLGSGSSQIIHIIVGAVARRAQDAGQPTQVVMPVPTFDAGASAAAARRLPVQAIPLRGNLEADLIALQAACEDFDGQSVVYLCNPNNPTGTVVDSAELRAWVEAAPQTLFLIDEAYVEYVTDSRFQPVDAWVRDGLPNVAVARTFSKLHGLAGLRVGYSLSSQENAALFATFLPEMPVNLLGLLAARASLGDTDFQRRSLDQTLLARRRVLDTLDRLGLRYADPQANFVFHELPAHLGGNRSYRQRMRERHVIVGRDFAAYEGWNRLSLGTPEEMAHVTAEMMQVLGQKE
ncbi:aminotransferase class I/II-fold pyridoxal phosphate-dependent enzyme [Deinococcus radiophilus]|uniref:Aminotransferase class I/II-fold pyridoxal phosphate-dependent enzyme n=2 Tax=Deinococcus radiophilus TaxID=32062 RepID=A0A3S0ID43_9DEIO|nr:aminotransferase class I/II-fold pyridoxal phosphate-dependent enzyme [Deinococcus radiophilus]